MRLGIDTKDGGFLHRICFTDQRLTAHGGRVSVATQVSKTTWIRRPARCELDGDFGESKVLR